MIDLDFIRKYIVYLHILFWLGYVVVITAFFSDFFSVGYSLRRAFVNGSFFAVFAYFNMFYLIPRLLEKKRFVEYALIIVGLIISFSLLRAQIKNPGQILPTIDNPQLMAYRSRAVIMLTFTITFIISTSYKLAEGWFQNLTYRAQLKNQQLEAELKFLRMQINPHFLFNTLNNIYTLCLFKEDTAPAMVMKLSHLMRYMLYECHEDEVLLSQEVNFLQDYVELQQLKTEKPQQIYFKIEGALQAYKIIPLLLLPLLENSFKHGNVDSHPEGWVNMQLNISERGKMHFCIANSVSDQPKQKPEASGIGIENTRRRLALVYPNRHTFEVEAAQEKFTVNLSIDLS